MEQILENAREPDPPKEPKPSLPTPRMVLSHEVQQEQQVRQREHQCELHEAQHSTPAQQIAPGHVLRAGEEQQQDKKGLQDHDRDGILRAKLADLRQ